MPASLTTQARVFMDWLLCTLGSVGLRGGQGKQLTKAKLGRWAGHE